MKKLLFLFASAFLAACSSSSTPSADAPTSCDSATQRIGNYLAHYDVVSGDCGAIPDSLVALTTPSSDGGASGGCTVNAEQETNGGCKINRDDTCPYPSGGTVRVVATSTQETQDGSLITGVETLYITATAGTCTGTYDVTLTRQ